MYLVSIDDLIPDQVVAKAATNENGAVLCPAGYRLTQAAIERLKTAGVVSVVIEGGGEEHRSRYAERLAGMERRFKGTDDPIMLQIKAVIERRLRFMIMESGGGSR